MNREQRRKQGRNGRKWGTVGGWSVVRRQANGLEVIEGQDLTDTQAFDLGEQVRATLTEGQTVTLRGPVVFDFG